MRKNKKLFAILTLVAFMMTLVPALAFATTATVSSAGVAAGTKTGTVKVTATVSAGDAADYCVYQADTEDGAVALIGGVAKQSVTAAGGTATFDNVPAIAADHYYVVGNEALTTSTAEISAQYDITARQAVAKQASDNMVVLHDMTGKLVDFTVVANAITEATDTMSAGAADVTITEIGAELDGILSPTLGTISKTPATDTTADVKFKVANKTSGDYAEKTVKVTVKAAASTTLDGVANAVSGQTVTVVTPATTAQLANVPAVGFVYTIVDADSSLLGVVNSLTAIDAAGAISGLIAPSSNKSGKVKVRIQKAGAPETKDVQFTLKYTTTAGGGTSDASVDASILATVDSNATVEVNGSATMNNVANWIDTKYAELDLVFRANNNASTAPSYPVYIWAEESGKSKQATDAFVLSNATRQIPVTNGGYVYEFTAGLNNSNTLKAAFVRGGTYTLKGSFQNPIDGNNTALKDVAVFKSVSGKTTITANALAQETRLFTVDVMQTKSNVDKTIATALADGEKTANSVSVDANTVATTKVTLTVYNKSDALMSTYPVKLSTNSGNIELDKTSVTTDYKGQATFNIAGLREGEYKVYVNIGDYEATLNVTVGATSANNIELIKFPANPIATDTMVADYADIFRFQLTDANSNIVKDTYKGVEYAAINATDGTSTSEQAKYASIVSAPEANKVKNADLKLQYVKEKDYYTLAIDNNKSFSAEGDYEVRVVLNNGKSVTLNFTVKKFDTATSLHVEYPTTAVELNSKTDAPDIYFLDANNVMKKANNRVTVAASGYAVAGIVESGSEAGTLTVKNDEKYIGQTITVTAASDKENLMATTTLTVADEAREVKLDTTRGQVNANNRVGFKVVDSTGHAVALGNDATVEVTAVVQNTGDADAKVSYSVSGSSKADLKSNGTGVINLSSNKETTATVQIMVKVSKPQTNANDNNTGLSTTYYTGTETFTFGAEADKSVVMTIGSKELVANNVPVATDVAPFIKDNRTWVPFRALTEAFGAEVEYNAENNTVTTKLNGKTVVLTVGSNVLTVNDEAVTMDVAPYIVDDRVVVPVRFVGEAFGFTVEATQDAAGATASVVFYQK